LKIKFSYQGIRNDFTFIADVRKLIVVIIKEEEKKLGEINIVFTSNSKILEINKYYLQHSYYTDVITFNNNKRDLICGDIYISVDQVIINAKKYNTEKYQELIRVIIHGVLHLIGYSDKVCSERINMRRKEDIYLCKLKRNLIEKTGLKL
jgi:probable rRNA maturation factor